MDRLTYLKQKHREIDVLIEREQACPDSDTTYLTELKMQKLAYKDEIDEIENEGT